MINPAQYTSVLQKASDEQLMNMLRRPDKIPSQFVVAEINRRQNMRQAAMADQQRQARVQEMAMAQQRPPAMGMQSGGIPSRQAFSTIDQLAQSGDYRSIQAFATDASVPDDVKRYAMSKIGGMRASANTSENNRPFLPRGDADRPFAINLSDSPSTDETAQSSPSEGSVFDRFIKGRNFGGSDESMLAGALGPEARKMLVNYEAGKVPLDPGLERAASEAAERAALNKRYSGIKDFGAGPMVAPGDDFASKAESIRQGNEGAPIGFPGAVDFSPALGMGKGNQNNNESEASKELNRTKTASEAAAQALSAFSVDINTVNNSNAGVKTPGVVTGNNSQANTAPNTGGITSTGGTTSGSTDRTIDINRVKTGSDKELPSQRSLAEQVAADNAATLATLRGGYDNLAAADKARAKELKKELDGVTSAMEDMAKVYDQTARTPENRIFRAMLDMGIKLMGTKESNFLSAISEASNVGLETFDRLNNEEKERLFKKYSATVDLAKTRADIVGKINTLMASADRTSLEGETKEIEGQIADRGTVLAAQQADVQNALEARKADATDVGLSIDAESKEDAAEQADTRIGQDAERIAISRDELAINRDLGQQRIDVQREGNNIRLTLGGKELELKALTAAANNAVQQERNAIDRFIANKPAASVAYLDEVASRFGEDVAKQMILGKSSNGMDIDNSSITTTARTFAENDFQMQPKIPGVEPENDDGTYSQGQYFDYHLKNIRTSIYGSAPGGSSAATTTGGQGSTYTYTAQGGLQSNSP